MAKFKVLNCVTEVVDIIKKQKRDEDDNLIWFEVEKPRKVKPNFYGQQCSKIGDTIEIKDEYLAGKARNNPDLEEVGAK